MAAIRAVHECLFCPQVFDSAAAKDDHVLEHFAQETCTDCNQNLIRIGGHLYTRHNAVTCIKGEFKSEPNNETGQIETVASEPAIAFIDETSVKEEPIPEVEFDNSKLFQFDTNLSAHIDDDTGQHVEVVEVKAEPTEQPDEQDILISEVESISQISAQSNSNGMNHNKVAAENRPKYDIREEYFRPNSLKRPKTDMHMESQTNIDKIKCESCDIVFKTKESRYTHMWRKHNLKKRLKCKLCDQVYPTESSLNGHHCSKSDSLKCKICGKVFGHKDSLRNHMQRKHNPNNETSKADLLKCDICGTMVSHKDSLRKHMRMKHDPTIEKFKCQLCHAVFLKESSLQEHHCRLREKPKKCPIPCDICGKVLPSKQAHEKHLILLHSLPGTIFCSACAQIFSNIDDLDAHQLECVVKRCIPCKICGKILGNKNSHRIHNILLHSPPDVIFCNICARKFPNTEERDTHRPECALKDRIRKSKKGDLCCDICRKILNSKNLLAKHKILAHSPDETIFCSKCARIFSNVTDRDTHEQECALELKMRRNQTYKRHRCSVVCELCGTIYGDKNSLRKHKTLMHSAPGTIFCRYCAKKFPNVIERDMHSVGCGLKKKISNSKHKTRRFECDICDEVFNAIYKIRDHMQKAHNIDMTKNRIT